MIGAFIVVCEVAFWVLVVTGLAVRYLGGRRLLGAALLAMTPVVDVVLIVATVVDLRAGASVGFFHGLAAVYVGVSVAFGHRMIRWADERFAHRFAGGPPPQRPPKYGREHARYERGGWYRHLLAWCIGSALLVGMAWLVGDPEASEALLGKAVLWACVVAIDFVWSFSYTLWPRRAKVS
ncbi:MAG: hypothetical protein AB1425_03160 [Actinomycetota bacterium]